MRSICVSLKFATTYVFAGTIISSDRAGLDHLAVVHAELATT